jgi:hypothetical protein
MVSCFAPSVCQTPPWTFEVIGYPRRCPAAAVEMPETCRSRRRDPAALTQARPMARRNRLIALAPQARCKPHNRMERSSPARSGMSCIGGSRRQQQPIRPNHRRTCPRAGARATGRADMPAQNAPPGPLHRDSIETSPCETSPCETSPWWRPALSIILKSQIARNISNRPVL